MMFEFPTWLEATLASDAAEGRGVLPTAIVSLRPGLQAIGPAYVVQMSQDDNLAVQQVLEALPAAGTVLVIAGGGESRTATIGGLMALEMQLAGIAGLVTDGLVRDAREIRALGFAVWCRGVTPRASGKQGPALAGGAVSIGGTLIRDGDLVVADDDGVVVWPQERIDDLLAKASARRERDEARLARLREGE